MRVADKRVVKRLVERGQEHMQEDRAISKFTGKRDYDELLCDLDNYPHAFVIACVMDRQIKGELAWSIPYELKERIGTFEFAALYELGPQEVSTYFSKPSPLHRFPERMSECLYRAIQRIGDEYDGVASRIWSDKASSAEVIYRFLRFHGVGPKIATMATNILARDFKIEFSDYHALAVSADVHVKRVFHRLGLTARDASADDAII